VPYRAPRDRRELWTAIAVASAIVIVTASLVWFLRPNRESTSAGDNPDVPAQTMPTVPTTVTTAAPTETTIPADTTPTADTAAPAGG
jgi:negative regulator of sigma E activity